MSVSETDIAWLAGIIDGEGCFSVKSPIIRKTGRRASQRTSYQVWLVLCNTSKAMVDRAAAILAAAGVQFQPIRKVWKGQKATRWQYWLSVARKHDLLRATLLLVPHLTAKKAEAEIVIWFLKRACAELNHKQTALDALLLDAMSSIKKNGGEAPAEIEKMIREVIPSQAACGHRVIGEQAEGVEARSVTPKNNPTHECPAPLRLVQGR